MGILIALIFYFYKQKYLVRFYNLFKPLYLISLNKWYIDEIYNLILIRPYFYLSNFFWKETDIKIIDKYGPNGISNLINIFSRRVSLFQSGYIYHYAFAMLGGLVILLTWLFYF